MSTESLRLGESVVVSHVPAPPRTRRARSKAARKTDKAERREAKAQKKREASRRYAKATAKSAAAAAAQQAAEEERLAREKARGKTGRRRRRKDKSAARFRGGQPRSRVTARIPPPRGRTLAAGERVLLVDRKDRRYLVTLHPGRSFQSHAGVVEHDELIGRGEGEEVEAHQKDGRVTNAARVTWCCARRSQMSS